MADPKARKRTASLSPQSLLRSAPLLNSPWLSHELFPATKKVASAPDGLAFAKKSAVAKVVQELKKGRNYIDAQLMQLEAQLLNVNDFLNNGATTTLFTDYGIPDAQLQTTENGASAGTAMGSQLMTGEEVPTSPNSAGLRSKFVQHNFPTSAATTSDKKNPLNPMGTLVEDDLASDAPCTTIGLWKYVSAYEIFKNVTLEDVEAALQLEETNPSANGSEQEFVFYHHPSAAEDTLKKQELSANPLDATMDDFLKARLVAAIVPIPKELTDEEASAEEKKEAKQAEEDSNGSSRSIKGEDGAEKTKTESTIVEEQAATWTASGISAALRDAGLLELSEEEMQKCMLHPEDDEVSSEIRYLEEMLREQIHRNNETKRVLRKLLQTMKPWLSQQEEQHQAIEKKYLSMWRRKKELERKQKLKDKKLMRKEGA